MAVDISSPLAGTTVARNFLAAGTATAMPTVTLENANGDVVTGGTGTVTFPANNVANAWIATFTLGANHTGLNLVASNGTDEAIESNITVSQPSPPPIVVKDLVFSPGGLDPLFGLRSKKRKDAEAAYKKRIAEDPDFAAEGPSITVSVTAPANAKLVLVSVFTQVDNTLSLIESKEAQPLNPTDWVSKTFVPNINGRYIAHVEAFNNKGKLLGRASRRKQK